MMYLVTFFQASTELFGVLFLAQLEWVCHIQIIYLKLNGFAFGEPIFYWLFLSFWHQLLASRWVSFLGFLSPFGTPWVRTQIWSSFLVSKLSLWWVSLLVFIIKIIYIQSNNLSPSYRMLTNYLDLWLYEMSVQSIVRTRNYRKFYEGSW